jgi:tetratricopeptide (TPR) repeat protein
MATSRAIEPSVSKYATPVVLLGLAVLTWAALGGVTRNGLTNFDDDRYVNLDVQNGLTFQGLTWAWTTTHASNYHPLTWMSLQADVEFFGGSIPGAFHVTNLVLHLANVWLLFAILLRMTRQVTASAAVAALWAVHPQHVESVAWVTERKDVLSTIFGLLAVLAYSRYVERPGWQRYLLVMLGLTASLLAKPMFVTLPFVLLLLDYWPLGRVRWGQECGHAGGTENATAVGRLLLEKVPLVLLVGASCWVTLVAQSQSGALKSLEQFPLSSRLANAAASVLWYLVQTFVPTNLAVYYPRPATGLEVGTVVGGCVLLAGVSVLAGVSARSKPYLLVGWLWFLGTLIPVLGIVQVGSQARADRYTYVPHIGLFIMVVWGTRDLVPQLMRGRVLLPLLFVVVAGCVVLTRRQVQSWADSESLWVHTLAVTQDNPLAHLNYGVYLRQRGRLDEAIEHLKLALRGDPGVERAYWNLGKAYREQGKLEAALAVYRQALSLWPDDPRYLVLVEDIEEQLEKAAREQRMAALPGRPARSAWT